MKKHIPNILTMANVMTGCLMMPFIISGNVRMSLILLLFALAFDFWDGFLSRLLDATTELGKNLDSLADMISFGVSSGMIMAYLIAQSLEVVWLPENLNQAYWLIGLLIPVFAAFRLARFNVEQQSHHFSGVPTPAIAILVFSLWFLFENKEKFGADFWLVLEEMGGLPVFWIGLTILSCLLMVVPMRLMALKFKGFSWGENRYRYVLIILSGFLLVVFQTLALPFIFLLYLAVSFISNALSPEKGT